MPKFYTQKEGVRQEIRAKIISCRISVFRFALQSIFMISNFHTEYAKIFLDMSLTTLYNHFIRNLAPGITNLQKIAQNWSKSAKIPPNMLLFSLIHAFRMESNTLGHFGCKSLPSKVLWLLIDHNYSI